VVRAIAAAGPGPALLETRAVVFMRRGRGDLAVKDLEAAVAEGTASKVDVAVGYFQLAKAHLMADDRSAAAEDLKKARAAGLTAAMVHPLDRDVFHKLLGNAARDVTDVAPTRGL